MPLLEATIPKFTAPTISLSSASSTVSVGANLPSFSSVPALPSPKLSLGSLTPTVNFTNTSNLSLGSISAAAVPTSIGGLAAAVGAPTTLAGAAAAFGAPTSIGGISAAFGGPSSLTGALGTAGLPSFNTVLPKLNLPAMPKIPGLDKAGILLGAGPKFIADKITKYTTIVPPFAPGLKINMAMVGGAIAIISALSSGNPSAILKSLAEDLVSEAIGDLKNQAGDAVKGALDQTGVSGMQDQLKGIQDSVSGATSAVTDAANTSVGGLTGDLSLSNMTPTVNLSAGTSNLSLSAISNPVSGATSAIGSKITAFNTPPTG
jgi:hypothetical protein